MKNKFLVFLLFIFTEQAFPQASIKDSSIAFPMLGASFQYQMPGADMADRFHENYNVGGFFNYKFANNWIIGLDGCFLFSEKVKEDDILDIISTYNGDIIGTSGEYATVRLKERGFMFSLKGGKLFPLFGPNKNSGLMTTVGVGLLEHKIRIDVDKDDVPALDKEYRKGYDHLSNGVSITEFIGYVHCGNNRRVNFMAGFEFTQAFTQSRRDYNFGEMKKDSKKRLDLLFGIKVCWFFPIYKHAATSYYYN